MNHPELLTDKEFLGFLQHWEKEFRAPYALADWLRERDLEDYAEVVRWCYEANGPSDGKMRCGVYPWRIFGTLSYHWCWGFEGDSNNLPMKTKLRGSGYSWTKEFTFPEAILYMFDLMVEHYKSRYHEISRTLDE